MICPRAGRWWAISFARYPAAQSSVTFSSLTEEAIHLPWPPDPDMVECFLETRGMKTWVLELKDGEAGGKAWGKKGESYLLIRAVNIERPPPHSPAPKRYINGMVGLPTPVLMRIP